MTATTAEKVVELALQSSSPVLAFELEARGGEPLLNFDVLRHLVDFARSRAGVAGKEVRFGVLTNFTAMNDERADWLVRQDVRISTSLDGPAALHDGVRKWKHGSSHEEVVRWIESLNRRYADLGRDRRVDGLVTVTRQTLAAWRELVDEYVARGMRSIHLRPLNPLGPARGVWESIGYSAAEYLDFYRRAFDYIVELNRRGVDLRERMASVFLSKILTSNDTEVVDLQSPCGDGTGQVVYDHDGRIFPSGDARMLFAMGEPLFELGRVGEVTLPELLRHATLRAVSAASLLDVQPMCADCWNKPFCGISPIYSFVTERSLFGQRPRSLECKEHMAISARLFELLADAHDKGTREVFERWVAQPRLAGDARVSKDPP